MNEEVVRPCLTLHVFGSCGCGKTSFKKQWFDGSHSRVLSEIADVHIRIQKECRFDDCGFILNSGLVDITNHSFLIMYRPDSQGSITYAYKCVEKLYSAFEDPQLEVSVLENHFESSFKPHAEAPVELPLSENLSNVLAGRPPPPLWKISVKDSVQLHNLLDSMITAPLLALLDEDNKAKVVEVACREGKVQVVKLLLGTMEGSNPVTWLAHAMTSLEMAGLSSAKTPALMAIAWFAYNLDHTLAMSTIVRLAEKYPKASLHLLDTFCQQGSSAEHLVKSGVALIFLPPSWVTSSCFTHINISNNLLLCLPEELFQMSSLRLLNASHNCIESIPSILKWNCPYLRDLDLSHNRLHNVPYCILEGRNRTADSHREREMEKNLPSKEEQRRQITATQRVLRLTGYNLYPCIRSVSRVNISSNPSLTQIPEWVCLLPSLTLLEALGLPKLTTITPYLAHCRFLCVLRVDTDNLVSPPPEEANRGTRVIMAYLRCKLRGSTPYRHLKLVLMGEAGSGKSTLFKQLINSRQSNGSPSPHMKEATFEFPPRLKVRKDRPKVTFHMIDFVGSEVYRCTHQCFLTYRSVYVCLWDITKGVEGLRKLCPWLRSIQACAPGSPVVLVATHADRRPAVSNATVVAQWEEEVLGNVSQLKKRSYAAKLGLPPVYHSVIMDCLCKEDVEHLMNDIYDMAVQLRHPRTQIPFLEDVVPRSYHELQSLVEVKVRSLCRDWQSAPILRHEEFVDYVRSLTLHNPEDLEQDEEEFALACNFLHEAGTIVHFRSHQAGVSDLYFLDPQWLFNTLASVVNSRVQSSNHSPIIMSGELPQIFQSAEIPPQFYNSFLLMMESFDILVSLDMEKNSFLIPSLLPTTPPPHYPSYNLADAANTITQYVQFDYLPIGFYPRLLARVLIYIRQLSGQLLAADSSPLTTGEDDTDWGLSGVINAVTSTIRSAFVYHSASLHLDRRGYMCKDDTRAPGDEGSLRNKIWALSNTNAMTLPCTRRRALTEKLVNISKPILQQRSPTGTSSKIDNKDPHRSLSHVDHFASYVFWKKGLFAEFPCGTRFWLEACDSAVALIITGRVVPRVKVLSFISSCIDVLMEECYSGLEVAYYSPCPSCMKRFWEESHSTMGRSPSFASSSLEVSEVIMLDEFNEKASYSRRPSIDSRSSYTFSGSSLKVNRSPSPPPGTVTSVATSNCHPSITILENNLTLFPLPTTILLSVSESSITCPKCEVDISLCSISPHVLLVDFSDKLLLKPELLQFQQDESSTLGRGGFGKVYRGTYDDVPVAVKVFRRPYKQDILLQQYKDLREELTIMSHLDHPRVVSLVGVVLRPLCMVIQLAPQSSLNDHLDLCPHGLHHNIAHRVLYQIADGIRYLHSLFIIHRDIKPGNVLVWSLHPDRGVDVRLADYGVSQFSTPSGLWRHKGTEEYMAPELFKAHRNQAYDEKVDIFSFALVLHLVVTGRKLFASVINKRQQLQMIYNAKFPQLSVALAEALTETTPPSPVSSSSQRFLEGGRHPAARPDVISSCHSVCMQQLMEDCLMINPADRPSAEGVCSRLLICPGGLPQANIFITAPVTQAVYSESADVVLAMRETSDYVLQLTPGNWQMQQLAIPYQGERICCMTVAGSEVFFASEDTNLVFSLQLPSLTSGHISPEPLPGKPLCIFPQQATSGDTRIIVGMSSGRIAIFVPPNNGRKHLLETKPIVTQVINHPDADKTAITCGVYHEGTVWCGCGRNIIGLDTKEYLLKHYKPVLKELTMVTHLEGSYHRIWITFNNRSEVVLCDCFSANCVNTIDCHAILGISGVSHSQAAVTNIVSSPEAVWVGTQGGHLIAFNPISTDVVLVHQRHSSLSCIVSLSAQQQLVTFGQAEVEGEFKDTLGMFTVWTSFVTVDQQSN